MSTLAERIRARRRYQEAKKKPVGEGNRFKAVEESARLGGAKNPVAAKIGIAKYGKKKMLAGKK